MSRKSPGYLRLHVEDVQLPPAASLEDGRGLATLCESFRRVTGWTLRVGSEHEEPTGCVWSEPIGGSDRPGGAVLSLLAPHDESQGGGQAPCATELDFASLQELAAAVGEVARELHRTRQALWQREAELAAGVPVAPHADEAGHLAARLEAVLKAGAQAVNCQAAAAYLLDESTKQLKLRSCWGLPKSRFLGAPRPLRGAAADLEALVGHAVVLEDTRLLSNWKVPEEFRAAVCVPISSPTVPFGTLWVYSNVSRGFSTHETNLIEIVAGRVAADLEREILLQQTLQSRKFQRQLVQAAACQRSRLPQIKPLLSGWQIAGWTSQRESLGGDFYDWFVLPDGLLAIAVGAAQGKSLEASFTCATVQAALKSHACYRHTAEQMVARINETLWTASTGDQFASLFYGLLQPASGVLAHALAGHVQASILGDTLRTLTAEEDPPLGAQPDSEYPSQREVLVGDEVLIVLSEGVQRALQQGRKQDFWNLICSHRRAPADDLIGMIESLFERFPDPEAQDDRTVLIVKRDPR